MYMIKKPEVIISPEFMGKIQNPKKKLENTFLPMDLDTGKMTKG